MRSDSQLNSTPITQPKTVLIVDDNSIDRKLLSQALSQRSDLKVIEAANGQVALQLLAEGLIPDLLILDILMPDQNGLTVLRHVRKLYNQLQLPVIMITQRSDSSEIVESLKLGANDHIAKPINIEIALSRIQTHLKLSELSQEMATFQQSGLLDALIATYNHEINNSLAIAIGHLNSLKAPSEENQMLEDALWRIADVVKRMEIAASQVMFEFNPYTNQSRMIKIR